MMHYIYEIKEHVRLSDCCEPEGRMSYEAIADQAEDGMSFCFGLFKCDNRTMRSEHNAMWVVARDEKRIYHRLQWDDVYTLRSEIASFNKISCIVRTTMTDEQGKLCLDALTEMIPLDFMSKKILRLKNIGWPEDMECADMPFELEKLGDREADFLTEKKTELLHLDVSRHVNNCRYSEFIFNTYSLEEYLKYEFTVLHCEYIHETKLGDDVKIYSSSDGKTDYFEMRRDDTPVYRMTIEKTARG